MGFFKRIRSTAEGIRRGLAKTHERLADGLGHLFSLHRKLDDDVCDELEELMVGADMGIQAASEIIDDIRQAHKEGRIEDTSNLRAYLKEELVRILGESDASLRMADQAPTVILVAGTNGSGKTTSIAKLAKHLHDNGRKVLLAASDTFRAAAVEQLDIWRERLGVDIVKHQTGADPAAVTFDAHRPQGRRAACRYRRTPAYQEEPDDRVGENPPRSFWCSTPPPARMRFSRPNSSTRPSR